MQRAFTLLIVIVIISHHNTYAQLWKQYSDSAKVFDNQKKTEKAIEYYYKAKEGLQKDSSNTNSNAQICYELASLYFNLGRYVKSEPFYLEARQIWGKIKGKRNPDYAKACNGLAVLYNLMGQYERAEPFHLEAKQIMEMIFGKESEAYATTCNDLANLYSDMGKYEKAELLYLEAKAIREKIFGKEHPNYASACQNLANLYVKMGQYKKAEPLYTAVKQIRESVLGKENSDYATICSNLSVFYRYIGKFEKAESFGLEANEIWGKVLGMQHPYYVSSYNNLAVLYMYMGKFEKAESFFREAKQIREKILGKEHPNYASSCNNLALLYYRMGQYEKSEHLHLEAKQIREKILGKEHPDYAISCDNLGILYTAMQQFMKAEPFHLEAKQIREKVFGKDHPDYALSCSNLGFLYTEMSQFKKAEAFHLEAKQIREKVFGKEDLTYYSSCFNLGRLYLDMGQYKQSEILYREGKQVMEKILGKEHPYYTSSYIELANLYWILSKPEKANNFYAEAFRSQNIQVNKIFQFTSEVEKQSYLKNISDYEKDYFSFYTTTHPYSHQGFIYNVSLSSRNSILSFYQHLRSMIYNSSDSGLKTKYNNWVDSKEQLSFWYSKPVSESQAYINDLEEQANTLEKELTRLSSAFKKEQLNSNVSWKNIQQQLKVNEAAIEFVEFNYSNGKRWTDCTFYIALILRKDKPEPAFVRLFEKKQMETLLSTAANLTTDNKINTLYSRNKSLYNLIWKPLEKHLTGISKIYFASAGTLFKISFAALPVNNKQTLSDKYQLIQLNTTASVTDKHQDFITAHDKIKLYGGIKYDADSATLKQAVSLFQTSTVTSRSLPEDLTRGAGFQYLPGTQQEVEELKKQADNTSTPVTILSGSNASEESFKALNGENSPSVLHIATHGFFFPDPKERRNDEILRKFETSGKVFKQSDNPLFRSGLVFTGANNAWQGKPVKGIEDGILTAYEVSNMYLPNTKLVVLSACETALGDIQGSEGVYGLQRSFKMAGVQNLVMSLWKVPDAETAEFMQVFYKNFFAKQTINNAFYNAQKIMKNKYRAEPYKWAAWILVR